MGIRGQRDPEEDGAEGADHLQQDKPSAATTEAVGGWDRRRRVGKEDEKLEAGDEVGHSPRLSPSATSGPTFVLVPSAPGRTRTSSLRFRRSPLYPVELQGRVSTDIGRKMRVDMDNVSLRAYTPRPLNGGGPVQVAGREGGAEWKQEESRARPRHGSYRDHWPGYRRRLCRISHPRCKIRWRGTCSSRRQPGCSPGRTAIT